MPLRLTYLPSYPQQLFAPVLPRGPKTQFPYHASPKHNHVPLCAAIVAIFPFCLPLSHHLLHHLPHPSRRPGYLLFFKGGEVALAEEEVEEEVKVDD